MDRSDRLSRTASVAYTKGLLNNPGENNCFLNSAVQVLWHLDVFRRSFRELSGHFCVGESCIFCALKVIFTQIQYSDEAALPPDALRQALAVTFKDQQRFQLQDMDDAAECLENILSRLHFHFAMNEKDEICNAGHCISHRKFAMEIMEQSVCNCGATSEPLPFFQLVHYVSVTALCQEAEILSSKLKGLDQDMFGHLLKRAVNQGDTRECPGNCGKRISVQQSLLNCPDVVCIGLIWDSDNPDIEQISELLDCVDPVLRLPEVFPRVSDDKAKKVELLLAGVVTYYGKHYSTFSYSNKMKTWIYFDDARVRKCGPDWEKIRDRCRKNHYQPLLLLYVNPHGRPVSTKSAPSEVKLVDTKTLLASPESARKHSGATSDKTTDIIGGSPSSTPEIKRKSRQGDSVDSLVSSPSSHSLGSEPGSEKDVESSAAERKKSKRSMKRLKTFGSDIKRALSRNKNESQPAELRNSSRSLHSLSTAKVESVKKSSSHDDLINLNEDARHKNILSLYEGPTRARELDECDSGLGSGGSQASSPATSSVSSVDTNTDDLIDFSTRTFPRSRGNDSNHKVDSMVEEAESHLRRSYELEKAGELALSLSFVTNATTRFRIAIEHCSTSHNPSFLTKLKNKYNLCLERSRDLHQRITAEKEARRLQFSQQQKQELLMKQRERDKQVLRENRQPTTSQGTLPRSFTKDRDAALEVKGVVPMSSRSINEVYLRDNRSKSAPSSPVSVRRPNSRTHHPGSIGTTRKPSDEDMRDSENCSQKIKPDALCYSPVHYGKLTSVCNDFERMKFANESSPQSRKTTVTHVSTSFVPERSLPIEQALLTSSVYALPNSRNSTKDIRRCSIYDNMPPSGDRRYASTVPLRTVITSSCTSNTPPQRVCNSGVERRSKAWSTPVYVDPPPYDRSRTQQNTGNFRDQSGTLLQRFNVPVASRGVETVGLPDDVPRMNGGVRAYRPLCQRCRKTYVEKNARCCRPCQALDNMLCDLKDDTAMHY